MSGETEKCGLTSSVSQDPCISSYYPFFLTILTILSQVYLRIIHIVSDFLSPYLLLISLFLSVCLSLSLYQLFTSVSLFISSSLSLSFLVFPCLICFISSPAHLCS